MTIHRIELSNGSIVLLEERINSLHICTAYDDGVDDGSYVCTIEPGGVLVMPNSGDATDYLARNLGRISPSIGLLCEDNGFDVTNAYAALSPGDQESFDHWKGWGLDTHCGQECVKIMEAAKPLLAIADPAAKATVWRGIIAAMSVVCCG